MTGISVLLRRAGIEPSEAKVFAWGAATFFLIGWASVSLANVSDTLFLKRVGVKLLPAVFLGSSLLLVGTTFVMARIAAHVPVAPLLRRTCLVLAAALVPLWLLVLADARSAFVLLMIAAKQAESIALMVFWVALGGRLHGRQAKRLYAPIIAGGSLGEIFGSFASGAIGSALGLAALVPVTAVAFGLAGVLAVPTGSHSQLQLARPAGRPGASTRRPRDALRAVWPLWREGRLFQLLVVSALLSGVLGPMLYFEFSYIADLATQGINGEQRLLALYAQFRGYLNVAVLAVQLVGTSWLFRRIGVPLASTFSPLVYLFGFLGFSLHLGLPAAVIAMAAASLQDHAIYDPAHKILVALFPERMRPAATSLIEGPVRRIGGVLGNVMVICTLALGTPAAVAFAGLPVAALWLAAAITLWRVYPSLLLEVASARRGPFERTLPEIADRSTLRLLETSLVDPDRERVEAACALVLEAPRRRAVEALARAVRWAPAVNRGVLIDTLHRVVSRDDGRLQAPEAARHLEELLDISELAAVERAQVLQLYADLVPDLMDQGSHAARVVANFLADPAECVRLAAAARLHGAGVPTPTTNIDGLLATALLSDDACVRQVALEELRAAVLWTDNLRRDPNTEPVWEFRIAQLAALLETPADRARAADVLADIAARYGARVASSADLVVAHARDPDPRVRAAVLRFIGNARLEKHAAWVVERLGADDEGEAAAARTALRLLGPAAMNALLDVVHFGRRAARSAVLPILQELPVDAATLRTLIDTEVDRIRRTLMQLHGLGTGRVSELALQRLHERVDESLHATLLLLATLLHEERIAVIGHLLSRFRGRGRALLVEALEALLPPEEGALLMPLLEGGSRPATAAAGALGRRLPSFDEALLDTLADSDALTLDFLALSRDISVPPAVLPGRQPALAAGTDLRDDIVEGGASPDHLMLSRVDIVLQLRALDLFASLTTRQLSELASVVREEGHAPGATIVSEGDFGDCLYIIVTGEVRVTREGKHIALLGPREFFGEMSLFDGETRSATAAAVSRVRLLRLERHDFLQVMDEHPMIGIAICQTLSRRVRDLIDQLRGSAESGTKPLAGKQKS